MNWRRGADPGLQERERHEPVRGRRSGSRHLVRVLPDQDAVVQPRMAHLAHRGRGGAGMSRHCGRIGRHQAQAQLLAGLRGEHRLAGAGRPRQFDLDA